MARRKGAAWALLATATALAVLAGPALGLSAILLAPALAARLLDRAPGRATARILMVYGAAASCQPMLALLRGTMEWRTALDLADPMTVAGSWAAQALGWLLTEVTPLALRGALDANTQRIANRLRATRARLEAEWSLTEP